VYVGIPPIPDDAPEAFKNAAAIRNFAWKHGKCPECEARPELGPHPDIGVLSVTFQHDPDCSVSRLLAGELEGES
jgi:hypothetical protein